VTANPEPVDSATVILLREAGGTCEVLLVERHADSRAFGGAHVFPGGRVDASDADPILHAASIGLSAADAAARLGEERPPHPALTFWIAAIRELFEETGILLATIDGTLISFRDPRLATRFRDHRSALLAGTATFAEIVARERLELATGHVDFFSRWITPVNAPRRYDARFFAARLPLGQEPLHDDRETVSTRWITPAAALTEAAAGALVLTPPTVRTLEDLQALATIPRVFEAARSRAHAPILPKVVQIDGRATILYPDDADYEHAAPGASLAASTPGRRNRVVMENGAWRSIRAESSS
jgi:8-oxo-dGTP pyrophosphatase MutT (NUDIX family)